MQQRLREERPSLRRIRHARLARSLAISPDNAAAVGSPDDLPNAVSGDFGVAAHPLFANKPANWILNHYGGVTHYFDTLKAPLSDLFRNVGLYSIKLFTSTIRPHHPHELVPAASAGGGAG